jgi:hypothetical protein
MTQTTPIEPTPEMVAFYERRTNEHIARVRKYLMLLAEVTDYGDELIERAKVHDASKFGPEERMPYVWLTDRMITLKLPEGPRIKGRLFDTARPGSAADAGLHANGWNRLHAACILETHE